MKELHILLVEDNEGDVILTLEAFEESEIKTKISVAKNGKDALDFLFKRESFKDVEKPDLVLLDLNIPIFSGMEVLKEVRQHPILKKMPIIILTTSSNPIEINKANEYQANSFVTKPIDMTEILKTILSLEEF
jgi:CheY-like chemotaxis protein|tara:strand:- start:23301 stop:23699 length:399 start_codon:yes stop_codon:yes gene_type:complete